MTGIRSLRVQIDFYWRTRALRGLHTFWCTYFIEKETQPCQPMLKPWLLYSNAMSTPISAANVWYCLIISPPDVIGVCKSVDEVSRLTTKTNREVSKRTINLMDMSGKVVTVTLWGEEVSGIRETIVGQLFNIDHVQRISTPALESCNFYTQWWMSLN